MSKLEEPLPAETLYDSMFAFDGGTVGVFYTLRFNSCVVKRRAPQSQVVMKCGDIEQINTLAIHSLTHKPMNVYAIITSYHRRLSSDTISPRSASPC